MAGTIQSVEELAALPISTIQADIPVVQKAAEKEEQLPITLKPLKIYNLFMVYDSCVGMEIINKIDHHTRSDRILRDNILKETMPAGACLGLFKR